MYSNLVSCKTGIGTFNIFVDGILKKSLFLLASTNAGNQLPIEFLFIDNI